MYKKDLLPVESERARYEVEITAGTPGTAIKNVSWKTENPRDLRLQIQSRAEKPFRWFKAKWRTYHKETIQRNIIDEIPVLQETSSPH